MIRSAAVLLNPRIQRHTQEYRDLYRRRVAVEREFGRLKTDYALAPLRVRGLARRKVGNVVEVALPDGTFAYGRLLKDAAIAFYRERSEAPASPPLGSRDCEFIIGVEYAALREWPVVGYDPAGHGEEDWPPPSFIRDSISGEYSIYERGEISPSRKDACRGLEAAAVWGANHVVDRLMGDHKWETPMTKPP